MKLVAKGYGSGMWSAIMRFFYYIIKYIKIHCILNFKWRINNTHNYTTIENLCNLNKICVGNYTQGPLDIRTSDVKNSYVKIGSYCSIASDVIFICYSNHPTDWISTYNIAGYLVPNINERITHLLFKRGKIFLNNEQKKKNLKERLTKKGERLCHGPIIIDDDVWIGTGAKIMSGVHIGQGAVIAAGAIVTKDIPPYAIAGGVPAKVIKYRFSEDKIKKLLKIDYSNTPIEKFRKIYPETIKEDFDIDYILKKIKE